MRKLLVLCLACLLFLGCQNTDMVPDETQDQNIGTILEFRITANPFDHEDIISLAEENEDGKIYLTNDKTRPDAWWVPVKVGSEANFVNEDLSDVGESSRYITRWVKSNRDANSQVIDPTKPVIEVLVVNDVWDVGGKYLISVSRGKDTFGEPLLYFTLNEEGGKRMSKLTMENCPVPADTPDYFRTRQIGIIVEGCIVSAPSIQSRISEYGQITGIKSREEADRLAKVLNGGHMPAKKWSWWPF